MNNNTLKVDGQITVTILATNKTPDQKYKDSIEEIKKRCEKEYEKKLKHFELMNKKAEEERNLRKLQEEEKLKKLEENHLQEIKKMEEYYLKQNKILDEKMKLKSQAINNEFNERYGYLEERWKKCAEENDNYMKIQCERLKQEEREREKRKEEKRKLIEEIQLKNDKLFEEKMKLIGEKAKLFSDINQKKFEQYYKYKNDLAEKDKKMFEMKMYMNQIEHEKQMLLMDNEQLKKVNELKERNQRIFDQYNQTINNQRVSQNIPYYNNNSYSEPLDNYSRRQNNSYYYF
jgi:hypothetical protein